MLVSAAENIRYSTNKTRLLNFPIINIDDVFKNCRLKFSCIDEIDHISSDSVVNILYFDGMGCFGLGSSTIPIENYYFSDLVNVRIEHI